MIQTLSKEGVVDDFEVMNSRKSAVAILFVCNMWICNKCTCDMIIKLECF